MHHELKLHPAPFAAAWAGAKTFEYRKDDRGGFNPGDRLTLREYDPATGAYSGAEIQALVTYVARGGAHGIPEGYAVLAIRVTWLDDRKVAGSATPVPGLPPAPEEPR